MREFKVGDRVWDKDFGFGVVTEINGNNNYPVYVDIDYDEVHYTADGFWRIGDKERSLFHADEVTPEMRKSK